jgi:hypothetical protein
MITWKRCKSNDKTIDVQVCSDMENITRYAVLQ